MDYVIQRRLLRTPPAHHHTLLTPSSLPPNRFTGQTLSCTIKNYCQEYQATVHYVSLQQYNVKDRVHPHTKQDSMIYFRRKFPYMSQTTSQCYMDFIDKENLHICNQTEKDLHLQEELIAKQKDAISKGLGKLGTKEQRILNWIARRKYKHKKHRDKGKNHEDETGQDVLEEMLAEKERLRDALNDHVSSRSLFEACRRNMTHSHPNMGDLPVEVPSGYLETWVVVGEMWLRRVEWTQRKAEAKMSREQHGISVGDKLCRMCKRMSEEEGLRHVISNPGGESIWRGKGRVSEVRFDGQMMRWMDEVAIGQREKNEKNQKWPSFTKEAFETWIRALFTIGSILSGPMPPSARRWYEIASATFLISQCSISETNVLIKAKRAADALLRHQVEASRKQKYGDKEVQSLSRQRIREWIGSRTELLRGRSPELDEIKKEQIELEKYSRKENSSKSAHSNPRPLGLSRSAPPINTHAPWGDWTDGHTKFLKRLQEEHEASQKLLDEESRELEKPRRIKEKTALHQVLRRKKEEHDLRLLNVSTSTQGPKDHQWREQKKQDLDVPRSSRAGIPELTRLAPLHQLRAEAERRVPGKKDVKIYRAEAERRVSEKEEVRIFKSVQSPNPDPRLREWLEQEQRRKKQDMELARSLRKEKPGLELSQVQRLHYEAAMKKHYEAAMKKMEKVKASTSAQIPQIKSSSKRLECRQIPSYSSLQKKKTESKDMKSSKPSAPIQPAIITPLGKVGGTKAKATYTTSRLPEVKSSKSSTSVQPSIITPFYLGEASGTKATGGTKAKAIYTTSRLPDVKSSQYFPPVQPAITPLGKASAPKATGGTKAKAIYTTSRLPDVRSSQYFPPVQPGITPLGKASAPKATGGTKAKAIYTTSRLTDVKSSKSSTPVQPSITPLGKARAPKATSLTEAKKSSKSSAPMQPDITPLAKASGTKATSGTEAKKSPKSSPLIQPAITPLGKASGTKATSLTEAKKSSKSFTPTPRQPAITPLGKASGMRAASSTEAKTIYTTSRLPRPSPPMIKPISPNDTSSLPRPIAIAITLRVPSKTNSSKENIPTRTVKPHHPQPSPNSHSLAKPKATTLRPRDHSTALSSLDRNAAMRSSLQARNAAMCAPSVPMMRSFRAENFPLVDFEGLWKI